MKKKTIDRSKARKMNGHRRVAKKPAIQGAIRKLAKEWNDLDHIARGESLLQLIEAGCSRRGLADDLGQSATSIRRHLEIAKLPDADKEAVRAGKSAKAVLASKALRERLQQSQERLVEDARTGVLSDQLADYILEFCKAETGVYGSDLDTVTLFFDEVRNFLARLEREGVKAPKVAKRLPLIQRFKLTCPKPEQDEFIAAHRARWLALFLKSEVSERPIQNRAIDKAQARRKELKIISTKTPLQVLAEVRRKYAGLSASPPRRRY